MKFFYSCSSCFVSFVLSARRAFPATCGVMKMLNIAVALLALLLSPSLSLAATYYVSPTGNDSNSGLSDAQAWKTIAKVNSQNFTNGDDIYFKCGGTWSGVVLQPNVQGVSESNRTVIGAYYGNGTIGVSGDRPIIDGSATGTGDTKFGTVPTMGSYTGLVHMVGANYLTIQDLQIQWSGCIGINLTDGSNNIIRTCTVFSSYRHGIRLISVSKESIYNTIEYNTVYDTSRQRLDNGTYSCSIGLVGGDPTPVTKQNTIRYNYAYDGHGEGIDVIKGSNANIIEYNTTVNHRSNNMYIDGAGVNNIFRYNLAYGYAGAKWGSSIGMRINDEAARGYAGTYGNKVYGNLIANCFAGIDLETQQTDSIIKDTEIYNNILVDNLTGILSNGGPYANSFVKNNIIWNTGERSGCVLARIPIDHSGLTFDYNLWSSQPVAEVRGSNDPPYSAPLLAKRSGWNSLVLGSLTGKEFALSPDSPAIGAGARLSAPFNRLLNPSVLDFRRNEFQLIDQETRGTWEIGACVFSTSSVLRAPSEFQLVVNP
jgi:parallel beta-helix repeat protein